MAEQLLATDQGVRMGSASGFSRVCGVRNPLRPAEARTARTGDTAVRRRLIYVDDVDQGPEGQNSLLGVSRPYGQDCRASSSPAELGGRR